MKEKKHFIFCLIILFSLGGLAQKTDSANLKKALLKTREDSSRVNILISLSAYYLNSAPNEARQYGEQAMELARNIHYKPGIALALKAIGDANYFLGNTPATLDYYNQSLQIFDSLGDMSRKAIIFNNLGNVYFMNGTRDKALENFFKALDIAEKNADKPGIAGAYANIGAVYKDQRATVDKARGYFLQSLKLSEEIGDKNTIGAVSVNLGEIYFELNKDDSAVYYFYKSLKAYENTINIPYPLRDIGLFYAKKNDFEKAIKFHEQSYEMAKKFDSKLDMTQTLLALGDTYSKKGDHRSALLSFQEADSIARLIPAYKELDQGYAGMAATYAKMGDYSKAYKYQKSFSSLADTLNNQTLADKLTTLQNDFEIQTRQNQINLLTKDKKLQELDLNSQKLQKTIVSGGLALIFIIALIILRNWIQSSRTNKLLDQQKVQIEGLLENILPTEVARELQRDGRATPRYYEKVSVLFTDFKDFTKHADTLSPQEIVTELSACFMAFDEIIEKYNLEKIKTIGDSYMAAGGIPTVNDTHTLNMIMASLEFQSYMSARNEERRGRGLSPWSLRVGIHVGPVVAGVVGKKKYAYDIWGSTVNIASRMESNGEPGMVNISADTYELVKEHYTCFYRGKIYAKNIGEIDMYFVQEPVVRAVGKVQPEVFKEVR
jgi:adenylate cyclase